MLEELNTQLSQLREQIRERQKALVSLEHARAARIEKQQLVDELAAVLQREEADVRRLEGMSLAGLLHSVLGDREEKLNQEQQEALSARLKYQAEKRGLDFLEEEITALEARAAQGSGLEEKYAALLDQTQSLLAKSPTPAGRRLAELAERSADLNADLRELNEAVEAGYQAEGAVRQTVDALNSAGNWGTWDILGGGMLSSVIKHSRLDEAREAAESSQPLLERFRRELADVQAATELDLPVDGLTRFVDIFMDSFLFDLLVQSRIRDSLARAEAVQTQVRGILVRLEGQAAAVRAQLALLDEERRRILEEAG